MPLHPEVQILLEEASLHVLKEESKLISRKIPKGKEKILSLMNELMINTHQLRISGNYNNKTTAKLTKLAKKIESSVDTISLRNWIHIPISVSAIYERIEQCLSKHQKAKEAPEVRTRNHLHNTRLQLMEQMIGARMLISHSDLGEEVERIFQHYLQTVLGSAFKVYRGGHICDYSGNNSCQVDIIVTSSAANTTVPSATSDGKPQVTIDQVLAAMFVTNTLDPKKFKSDWTAIQTIPTHQYLKEDYPQFKINTWPLISIIAQRSFPIIEIEKMWSQLAKEKALVHVPQFLLALDSGFVFSGKTDWPQPRYPNMDSADETHAEMGIYAGIGLALIVNQIRARHALLSMQSLGPAKRQNILLSKALMKEAVPNTYSPRFQTWFQKTTIDGILNWGGTSRFLHNGLQARCIQRNDPSAQTQYEVNYYIHNTDIKLLNFENHSNFLRWFKYEVKEFNGNHVALEEYVLSPNNYPKKRIVIFDFTTGDEVSLRENQVLNNVSDIKTATI